MNQDLKNIFRNFNKVRVLIIGDVMIDSYVWGKVSRISPEAPVPVVAVSKKEIRLGGAANVALNIQAMGAIPLLCSVVGEDQNGAAFLSLLKNNKMTGEGIIRSAKRVTTVKTRIIGNNHQLLRIDEEMESGISSADEEKLFAKINSLVKSKKADVIIFEDYNKGTITAELIRRVIQLAKQNNIPTVVDPKKSNFYEYKGVSLFKPNLKELREGTKEDFDADDIIAFNKGMDKFKKKQEIEALMVTLSEKGIYINSGKDKKIIPAHARSISDVSGAGDTVVSIAALCIALKLSPVFTAALANLGGGLVCESVGVVPVDKEKLLQEALTYNLSN